MNRAERTGLVKRLAQESGFSFCGVARAECLDREAKALERWLAAGCHGQMAYLADQFDLRTDPRRLMPGTKSVVSVLGNYYPGAPPELSSSFQISIYAQGQDYHRIMKDKMSLLVDRLRAQLGTIQARCCVDSAPIMEKAWAARAGLGWIGKHGVLLRRKAGSFFFLGELLLDIELDYDDEGVDHCGTCRRCIEACPTDAIVAPHVIDARRCISYLTIEMKGDMPPEMAGRYAGWIFGCDICQRACPFNRFAVPGRWPPAPRRREILALSDDGWRSLSAARFEELVTQTAVARASYERLRRNIRFVDHTEGGE